MRALHAIWGEGKQKHFSAPVLCPSIAVAWRKCLRLEFTRAFLVFADIFKYSKIGVRNHLETTLPRVHWKLNLIFLKTSNQPITFLKHLYQGMGAVHIVMCHVMSQPHQNLCSPGNINYPVNNTSRNRWASFYWLSSILVFHVDSEHFIIVPFINLIPFWL